jgi:hypothetical protein
MKYLAVGFKRDFRMRDHIPLAKTAARGPMIPLSIIEASRFKAPDFAPSKGPSSIAHSPNSAEYSHTPASRQPGFSRRRPG